MPFIKTIPPKKATGETARVYEQMAELSGIEDRVPKVVQVFSLKPASMRRMMRNWELALWMGDEPRDLREMMGAAVSRLNRCGY